MSEPDLFYLRILYRQLDTLIAAGATPEQRRQGQRIRHAVTAALSELGWQDLDIAQATGRRRRVVTRWRLRAAVGDQVAGIVVAPPLGPDAKTTRPRRLPPTGPRGRLWPADTHVLADLDAAGVIALNPGEVAAVYGVGEATVRRWVHLGALPAIRILDRGWIRIPRAAVTDPLQVRPCPRTRSRQATPV